MNFASILKSLSFQTLLLISGFSAFAQIEVHHESMHHPVFTNKIARVLDVIAQPGDTSLIHKHANNYCYVTVQGGSVWLESPGEKGRMAELPIGFIGGYYDNPSVPLVHRFANLSHAPIRLIAVENLSSAGEPTDSISTNTQTEEVIIDNPYFQITKISISAKGFLEIQPNRSCVIVNLESKQLHLSKEKETLLKQWAWVDAYQTFSIYNHLNDDALIVVIKVKSKK